MKNGNYRKQEKRAHAHRQFYRMRFRANDMDFAFQWILGSAVARMRKCFRRGGALLHPPIEPIEVPFEGAVLPGYFRKAAADGEKRRTLLMIGGDETFAEVYYFIAPEATERTATS
jgi:hypothetical protein